MNYSSFDMSDHDHESIQSDYTTSHFSVRELYTNDDYSSTCSSVGTDKVRVMFIKEELVFL